MFPPKFVALGIFTIASVLLPIPANATSMNYADGSVLKWEGGRDQMTTFFIVVNHLPWLTLLHMALLSMHGATLDLQKALASPCRIMGFP